MSPRDGIVLVAHSRDSYWTEAATLAKSIRRFSPDVNLALVTNLAVPEPVARAVGFTHVCRHDFTTLQGLEFKLHLDSLSPFSGTTLFVDSDCICYGGVAGVFDEFAGKDFVALGRPLTACHWFADATKTMASLGIREFPFFCGDFYLFRKSPLATRIFTAARDLAQRYDDLGINRLGRMLNDEPLIALAMAKNGVAAQSSVTSWILQLQAQHLSGVNLDYAASRAEALVAGAMVRPRLVHFQVQRTRPVYFRERFRVATHGDPWTARWLAPAVGFWQSLLFRTTKRIRRNLAGP